MSESGSDDSTTQSRDFAYVKMLTHCRFRHAHISLPLTRDFLTYILYVFHSSLVVYPHLPTYTHNISGGERFAAATQRVWNYLLVLLRTWQ